MEALQERQQQPTYTDAELARVDDIRVDILRFAPPNGVAELASTMRVTESDHWLELQHPHTVTALGHLCVAYDRARTKGLVADIGTNGADLLTTAAAEHLITMSLLDELRRSFVPRDPGLYLSPRKIALWRAAHVPPMKDAQFRQAIHRFSNREFLIPNLLALLHDKDATDAHRVPVSDVLLYRRRAADGADSAGDT